MAHALLAEAVVAVEIEQIVPPILFAIPRLEPIPKRAVAQAVQDARVEPEHERVDRCQSPVSVRVKQAIVSPSSFDSNLANSY